MRIVVGSRPLVFEPLRTWRSSFDFACCRSADGQGVMRSVNHFRLTDEPLYSSNSLSSSSISVYATLMWEIGRSNDDRVVSAEEKNDCVFALWNISTPGSSGVIGVIACWEKLSPRLTDSVQLESFDLP